MYANQFIYSRERRRFGRQCMFTDRNELLLSVHPSARLRMKFILRNPACAHTQLSDQKALSIIETDNVVLDHRGLFHYEGGWPKEININDEEQTLRHRKKVERDDTWGAQVTNLLERAKTVAEQNNIMNIYQEFFADLPPQLGSNIHMPFEARPIIVFHDFWMPPRAVVECDWSANNSTLFTVLHKVGHDVPLDTITLRPDEREMGTMNGFFTYHMTNPLKPTNIFDGDRVITRAFICPRDDTNMAGGYKTGHSIVWDANAGGMPLRVCPLEAAHREEVSSLCWVHSKSNTEFYTGSLDGSIKYWDSRDLVMPMQELLLEVNPGERQQRRDAHGVTVLEFEYTIPVRYMVGSDMGYVFVGNRKGMTAQEAILNWFRIFSGPVRVIQRNPFFVKNFLLCGDWRLRIWAEECKGAPSTMYFKKKNQILSGAWSTGRCSLFATGDDKGFLDFWDLLLDQQKPIHTLMFQEAITNITFRPDGDLMTVSLCNGDTFILELDEAMKASNSKEKALIAAMFEREISRSKLLEARVEEIKLKRRTVQLAEEERIRKTLDMNAPIEIEYDPDDPEQFVTMVEQDEEYRQAVSNFQDIIFKVEKARSNRKFIMERTDFEQYYLDRLAERGSFASLSNAIP